jgi:hypothetical protein
MTDQPSLSISVNPGSGPVSAATEENATHNMAVFILDLGVRNLTATGATRTPDKDYGEGRYAFSVAMADGRTLEVQMPGLPLDQVRWLKSESQDIWQFPRLYVDDSSWIWYFALDQFLSDDAPRRWPDGTVIGGEVIRFSSGGDA